MTFPETKFFAMEEHFKFQEIVHSDINYFLNNFTDG